MSEAPRRRGKVAPLRASDIARVREQAPAPASGVGNDTTTQTASRVNGGTPKSKFTASLDFDQLDQFDRLAAAARRKLAMQVDKLDVLTALVQLAADDAALRDQMIELIGERKRG
ncbi:hypothetical protein ACL02T_34495 [Pseudonocardia sp. RS010]|uniref:hypothetical protein n=1 Tax=Pseudonocardia sp. RS010 TaxID=3385979 RepID=UPI0039A1C9B0